MSKIMHAIARTFAVCALALTAGCADTMDVAEGDIPLSDRAISFDVTAHNDNKAESRGTEYNATNNLNAEGKKMVVNGFYYNGQASYGQAYMYDQVVTHNASKWDYSPVKYWPNQGTVDFYAYAPATRGQDGKAVLPGNEKVKVNVTDNIASLYYDDDGNGTRNGGETDQDIDASAFFSQLSYYHDQYNALLMRCDMPASKVLNPRTQFEGTSSIVIPDPIVEGTRNPENGEPYTESDVSARNTEIENAKTQRATELANSALPKFAAANDALYQTDVMFAYTRGESKPAVTEKVNFKFGHVMAALDVPLPAKCLKDLYSQTSGEGDGAHELLNTTKDNTVAYMLVGIGNLHTGGTLALSDPVSPATTPTATWTTQMSGTGKYYKVYRLEKNGDTAGNWTVTAMVGTESYTLDLKKDYNATPADSYVNPEPGKTPYSGSFTPLFFYVPAQHLTNEFIVTVRLYDATGAALSLGKDANTNEPIYEIQSRGNNLTLEAGKKAVLTFPLN